MTIARRPFEYSFIAVWLGYFGLMWLWGFESSYDNFWLAISYQMIFVVGVLGTFIALSRRCRSCPVETGEAWPFVVCGLFISILAILCLFAAKIEAGVDYSVGVCQARYQMGATGRTGTPLSVFGNLFSYAFFVPVAAVITQNATRRLFWVTIGGAFICLMALSLVTASRSTLMMFCVFCLACVCIRLIIGKSIPKIHLADILPVIAIMAVMALFVLSVFSCRAAASGISAAQYQENFQKYMGMNGFSGDDATGAIDAGLRNQANGFVGMTVLYVVHSAYTFDGVLSLPDAGYGQVLLRYPRQLLARVGLMEPPQDWILAGRFTSLPGALYHDYGLAGLIGGAIALGVLAWLAVVVVRRFATNVAVVGGVAMFFTILLLSPIHPAEEFMAFPFICVTFLVVPALVRPLTKACRKIVANQ